MAQDIKSMLYTIVLAVLLIVSIFTGEVVTFAMLLLIYILLNNMYNTMLENQALLKKSLQRDNDAAEKESKLD